MAIDYTTRAVSHKDNGTVVLIGPLGIIQEIWEPRVVTLGEKYQAITPDVRGRGGSPIPEGGRGISHLAADLIEVLNEEDVDRVHFVGLSLGGAIAQTIALEHVDRAVSPTLSSTAPKFGTPEVWQEKAELVCDKDTVALADTVIRDWFTGECFDTTPELSAYFRDMIADYPDDGYTGACEALSCFDTREHPAEITAPMLVVAGKQDTSTSLDVVISPHDDVEGSAMVVVSSAKHLLNQGAPKHFNLALLVHVDGTVDQHLIATVENKK